MLAVTFLSGLVSTFAVVFWEAFVVAKLWNWFGASAFGGAQLNMIHVYGLIIMINILRGYRPPESAKADTSTPEARRVAVKTACLMLFKTTWNRFTASLSALSIAWLVHHYGMQ